MRCIVNNHPSSDVQLLFVESDAPIFLPSNHKRLWLVANGLIRKTTSGDIYLDKNWPSPHGYGRSLRALIFGLEYKCVRRIRDDANVFFRNSFGVPQPTPMYDRYAPKGRL